MEAEPPSPARKPLDPLVKTALTISFSLIALTVVGMILTAPDRSIPPYSVMAQAGEAVTVSVPPGTTDAQIEALLARFRAVAHDDRNGFRKLKIKPTTPEDPAGRYQRMTIYVLDNPGLAEEPALKEYLANADPMAKGSFERGVRGVYRLTVDSELGTLGLLPERPKPVAVPESGSRVLFEGKLERERASP